MKKNFYFRETTGRQNVLKLIVLTIFLTISSYPRLLIEVFIRKDFGERYFKLSSVITVFLILALWPILPQLFDGFDFEETGNPFIGNISLYLYLCAFIFFSIKRYMETRRNPSVFDTEKYSLYSGTIHPFFVNMKIGGKEPNARLIETVLEPAPFFIAGVILWVCHQNLGIVLTFCSVVYALSYVAMYAQGDNFVMDMLDEMILNQELENAFVNNAKPEDAKGVNIRGRKPADEDMRRRLVLNMMEQEPEYDVS